MSQVALGHVNAGLSSLGHAVRLDPANHFAWNGLARVLLALGRSQEAEDAWRTALRARPDDVDLMVSMAVAQAAQGRTTEALRTLGRATEVEPGSARAWSQLGVVALTHQDLGTAGEALLRALDLAPDNEEALFHLAVLHVLVGAREEAIATLRDLAGGSSSFADQARALAERLAAQS
jgi:Flp pilus assembly protein TadD